MREKPRLRPKIGVLPLRRGGRCRVEGAKMPREGARGAARGEEAEALRGDRGGDRRRAPAALKGGVGVLRCGRCDRADAMRRGRTGEPWLRFVCGFATQEGGMQCRGSGAMRWGRAGKTGVEVCLRLCGAGGRNAMRPVGCNAAGPNGPALKGVDGCGKEKRGVEGAAGGVEGRGIALVGRCPRG